MQIIYNKPPAARAGGKRGGGVGGKRQKRSADTTSSATSTRRHAAASGDGEEDDEKEADDYYYASLPVFLQPDPSKQCYGIDCTNPARKNSKFCSTACGYTFYERYVHKPAAALRCRLENSAEYYTIQFLYACRALERHLKPAVEKRIAHPELFGAKKIEDEMETLRMQRLKFQEEIRKLNVMDGKLELLVAEAKRVAVRQDSRAGSDDDRDDDDDTNDDDDEDGSVSPTTPPTRGGGAAAAFLLPKEDRKKSSTTDANPQQQQGSSVDPVLADGTFVCNMCGKAVQKSTGLRHVEKCYKRAEKYNNFSSGYRAEGEAVKVFCDHFSKKDGSYCKRLKFICPEHHHTARDNNPQQQQQQPAAADEVCGFPLNLPSTALADENFVPPSSSSSSSSASELRYCNDHRRDCAVHYNWENMWRSLIASRKLQTWIKVEENIAREFKLRRQPTIAAATTTTTTSMQQQPTFDIVALLGDNLEYSC